MLRSKETCGGVIFFYQPESTRAMTSRERRETTESERPFQPQLSLFTGRHAGHQSRPSMLNTRFC